MILRSALILVILFLGAPLWTSAQDVWRTPDGKAVPESSSQKAVNGFGVSLLITDDRDWQAKWETPSSTIPRFNSASHVKTGGTLSILTFVANPKANPATGEVNVLSHILVLRPDGSNALDAPNLPCLRDVLQGPSTHTRICEAVIAFQVDPGDERGLWKVQVTVTDTNRGTAVPVEATFMVLPE